MTEICRIDPKCNSSKHDVLSFKCVYCALKTYLTSSQQQQLPLAPRLLARSNEPRILNDNYDSKLNLPPDPSSYDEYYEYDDHEILDENEFGEEDDYLDDYIEPIDAIQDRLQPIRKLGTCPKVVEAIGQCNTERILQPNCRFDTDCPGELKCCQAACGRRACNIPIRSKSND